MYFYKFPTIDYDATGDKVTTKIQDILTRIAVRKGIRDRNVLFSKYEVKDWETPESVSMQFYNSPHYHWVIMMMNKMFSRYYDWPMSERALQAYTFDKWGSPFGPDANHHYEATQTSGNTAVKLRVKSDFSGAVAVTNLEYERAVNEAKRPIKILGEFYLGQFLDEHSKVFGNI